MYITFNIELRTIQYNKNISSYLLIFTTSPNAAIYYIKMTLITFGNCIERYSPIFNS